MIGSSEFFVTKTMENCERFFVHTVVVTVERDMREQILRTHQLQCKIEFLHSAREPENIASNERRQSNFPKK